MLFMTKAKDLDMVLEMLKEAELSTTDVEKFLPTFMTAELDGEIAGVIGLEIYGENALLRSLVIKPQFRRQRLGSGLVRALLNMADLRGVKRVYLFTANEVNKQFFSTLQFTEVERSEVEKACRESNTLGECCNCLPMVVDVGGFFASGCQHCPSN